MFVSTDTQRSIREVTVTQIANYDSTILNRLDFDTRVMNSEVMANISPNDYVVHERYGVGLFKGFTRLTVGPNEGEYVEIQFKGADKLYMPWIRFHCFIAIRAQKHHQP